jgi:periplasmic copper chaperone A
MNQFTRLAALAALVAMPFTSPALAHDYKAGDLTINHPWSRPTAPNAKTGAVYMTVKNTGLTPDRLMAASSPVADKTALHVTLRDGDVMRMREVSEIIIQPGETVTLAPGGTHMMFEGLKTPLVAGERVPVTLTFAKAGVVEVVSAVDKSGAATGHEHKH